MSAVQFERKRKRGEEENIQNGDAQLQPTAEVHDDPVIGTEFAQHAEPVQKQNANHLAEKISVEDEDNGWGKWDGNIYWPAKKLSVEECENLMFPKLAARRRLAARRMLAAAKQKHQ